jgi:tripartite-type tricarboxylate transporter receptor subunit TctC
VTFSKDIVLQQDECRCKPTLLEVSGWLSEAAAVALAKPEAREKLLAIGLIPVGSTPEGLAQELAANAAFWQPIVKATGYKITN